MESTTSEPDVHPQTLTSFRSSSSTLPLSDPTPTSLTKTSSFSKLNAGAPEFVPRATSSTAASPTSFSSQGTSGDRAANFVFPRPHGRPAMIHVYNNALKQVSPPIDGHYGYGYGYGGQFYGGHGGALDRQNDLLSLSPLAHNSVNPSVVPVNSDATPAATSLNNGLYEEAALKLMKQANH